MVPQQDLTMDMRNGSWHHFFEAIRTKAPWLYYYGLIHLIGAVLLILFRPVFDFEVMGMHALTKPTKFFLSSVLVAWAMAYFIPFLRKPKVLRRYTWTLILVFTFENLYIVVQAFRGVRSHFNMSDWFGPVLFPLMGIAISIFTIHTLFIGIRFWRAKLPELSPGLRAGIRWGIILFSIFAFEGGMIGANQGHVIGGPEVAEGLPFLGWKLYHGDLRVAHFFGMHAMQVLPLLGAWVFAKKAWAVHVVALLYGGLSFGILYWALLGRGLLG